MINVAIYTAVVLFASSSWLFINSVWMELSLLTQVLPEGWSLPSYLDVTIQLACALPLLFAVVHKFFPTVEISFKAPLILSLLIFSAFCTILVAFQWDGTAVVFGQNRSVVLITLTFLMAFVNATSNVLFMPYMASFHTSYLSAYFVGMGLSALVPSIVSLLQGTMRYKCVLNQRMELVPAFSPPRFHIQQYYLFMFGWLCLSIAAFVLLHWFTHLLLLDKFGHLTPKVVASTTRHTSSSLSTCPAATVSDPRKFRVLLVCLVVVSSQMNSIIPSIQVYAALPYSLLTYHLALSLANLAQPIACFLPLWLRPKCASVVVGLTCATSLVCCFIVALAFQSPAPMLKDSVFGSFISIFASILSFTLNAYLRTVITSTLREESGEADREGRLFLCGVVMQGGSLIGALLMFPLVNVFNIFQASPLCTVS